MWDAYKKEAYHREVFPQENDAWRTATTPPRRDPLAIDLDGDGIETVGIPATGSPVLFDHDGDGVKTGTGWVKGDDAWLVLDRNGNGTIDTGAELFGVDTMITVTEAPFGGPAAETVTRRALSGFEALATLDTNHDGVFDASDAAFAQVKLWQDLNQDGISQSGELFSLADKGITAISLNASTTTTNLGNGNTVTGQASVTRSNGSSTQIDSVDLQAGNLTLADNPFYRQFTDTIPLSTQAQALPAMGGSGWLRDLREAMSLGTAKAATLTQLVSNFAATTTRDGQRAQLDGLIDAWARTTGRVDTSAARGVTGTLVSQTAGTRTIRYTTAEPIEGQSTVPQGPGTLAVIMGLPSNYYVNVVIAGAVTQQLTAEGQEVFRRLSELEVFNAQRFVSFNETYGLSGGGGSGSGGGGGGGGGGAAGTIWCRVNLAQEQVDALNASYDSLRESVYQALVTQTRLRPYLDAIDLVIDAAGIHFDTTALAAKLGANKTADERNALLDLVDLNRYADATLRPVGFDGMVTLRTWIDALPAGSALRAELPMLDVLAASASNGSARPDIYLGDAGANTFNAGNGNDIVDGGGGSDTLHGASGDDVLLGRDGDDYLYGEDGDDTFEGGAGNDYVSGDAGSDIYLFGKGDGQDTIGVDYVAEAGKLNVLQFKAGVAPSEIVVTRSGADLVLSIAGTTDKVTVAYFFFSDDANNSYNAVQQVSFDDGTSWDVAAIMAKAIAGNDTAQTLTAYAGADVINAAGGDDYVYGKAGDDTLDGGAGADWIEGGDGNDVVRGGADNDYLYGAIGNDTLDGGTGNDYLDGAAGNDTYLFGKGDGQDTIGVDYVTEAGKLNVLQFKAGVVPAEVVVTRSGADLVLSIAGTTDKVTIGYFFFSDDPTNSYNAVQQVRFNDGSSWNIATIMAMAIAGNDTAQTLTGYANADVINAAGGDDYVDGHFGDDTLDGGAGSDTLHGNQDNDILRGGADNDYLYGDEGNDTLDGGAGNDYVSGDAGNDTYLFGKGDGQDTIGVDYVTEAGKLNVLQFKAGVAPSEVVVTRSGADLVLSIAGTTDKVTIGFFFFSDDPNNSYNAIQQVKFNDGSSWNIATIMAMAITGNGTAQTLTGYATADVINAAGGDDYVYGKAGDDTLDGGAGADWVFGGDGNDIVRGGADNDYLYGDNGNDTLDGGAGNDFLDGAEGNDTYLFGKGDGQDTIGIEYVTEAGKLNVLQFKAGVAPSEVVVTRSSIDLVLSIAGTTDKITIGNFFRDDDPANSYNPIQQIRFNDGSSWNVATVMAKAIVGNDTAQTLTGYGTADVINAAGGDDYVYGHLGDDTLDGGAGSDTLHGNEGNDTLKGGADNDYLYGEDGNDTLDGGAGPDTLDGGMGNDTYVVDVATDTVIEYAAAGTDLVQSSVTYTLTANVENLILTGTTAISATGNTLDNVLTGNSANNTLAGGAGNDTLDGGAGNDTMLGGAGNDIYAVNVGTDVVTENASEGTDLVQSAVTWTLGANLENLTLTGTTAINGTGNTLDNVLTGNGANNTLTGGAGNDTLDGGLGNDTMIGGAGNDTFVVNVATDVITENANEGIDTVQSAVAWTLSANLENLTLTGTAAINGTGNANTNTLIGNSAANTLSGAEGNDIYDGAAGNDALSDTSLTSSDTYRWGLGMGTDTITDKGGALDHVDLFAGVTKSQLKFTKNANNLELTITGASDKLVVTNWYLGAANQIEEFRLADGSKVLASEVQGLLSAMAVFNVPAASPGIATDQARVLPAIWRGADLAVAA